MFKFKLTLFIKIFLIGIACLLASLWGVTLINLYTFQQSYLQNLQHSARGIAMIVELDIKTALNWNGELADIANDNREYIANFFAHDEFKTILTKYAVIDKNGTILSHYEIERINDKIPAQVLEIIQPIKRPITLRQTYSYDTYIPIIFENQVQGYILVGFTARIIDQHVETVLWEAIYVTLIALVLATLIFALSISFYVTRPLHNLIDKMREIKQSGNLATWQRKFKFIPMMKCRTLPFTSML